MTTWPAPGTVPSAARLCSALGDGYSGTYYSNDGGHTWCCASTDPAHLGTLIPGVTRLTGGQYDAGGDPALAFDSHGHVYYAGLGFNRNSAPNTVAVNRQLNSFFLCRGAWLRLRIAPCANSPAHARMPINRSFTL